MKFNPATHEPPYRSARSGRTSIRTVGTLMWINRPGRKPCLLVKCPSNPAA